MQNQCLKIKVTFQTGMVDKTSDEEIERFAKESMEQYSFIFDALDDL